MAPRYEDADFELADPAALLARWPQHRDRIDALS
jgi:hypothetical protein